MPTPLQPGDKVQVTDHRRYHGCVLTLLRIEAEGLHRDGRYVCARTNGEVHVASCAPVRTYDLVHLADDEWGNDLMEQVAREWFAQHPQCEFVEVHEHAGWWLGYHRSMVIVGTANSSALLPADRPRPSHFSGTCHRRPSRAGREAALT